MDAPAVRDSRLLQFVTDTLGVKVRKNAEEFPPIARGLGLTVLPRPERFHYVIGRAISTVRYRGRENDKPTLMRICDRVAAELRQLTEKGKDFRDAARKNEAVWRKLLRKF